MAIGAADLHKAVSALWASAGLDTEFKSYWSVADRSEFLTLNDGEGSPAQPLPHCVFQSDPGRTSIRMSGVETALREIRDTSWEFKVYAKVTLSSSAKTVAAALAELIMAVFGGHPTVAPQAITLDNGCLVICQFQTDYGMREADDQYSWTIRYLFRIDVPQA